MTTVPSNPNWIPSTPALSEEDLLAPVMTVVHYWAIWDLHDREMDRRLSAIRPEYERRIVFRSCDVDRSENLQFFMDAGNVPALGSYVRGSRFKIKIGLRSENELRQILNDWLAEAVSQRANDARA